jgi:C1A family cysteine protease
MLKSNYKTAKNIFAILILLTVLITGCSTKNKSTKEGTGMKFTDKETLNKINKAKAPFIGSSKIPQSVDLSSKLPPPGNQGAQNSCVGWSIAYGMKSYQEKTARNWELTSGGDINKNHIFSPAYIYNQINGGQDNGAMFADAFNLLQSKGVASLSTDPYNDADYLSKPNPDAVSEAQNFKIAWAKTIDPKDHNGIKSYLAKGYPVVIAIAFDETFMDPKGPAVITPMKIDENAMGHAMLIVGYDEGKKAFKIMNSWGKEWRDGGFCWMPYDVAKQCLRECWIAKDEEEKKDIKPDDEVKIDNDNPIVDELLADITIKDINSNSSNPDGNDNGKYIKISGSVKLDKNFGDVAQILVLFDYDNGTPVLAADENFAYYDDGGAAGISEAIDLSAFDDEVRNFTIYIPVNALKIDNNKTGNILVTPVLFIDDFDATSGKQFAFKIAG